MLNTLIRLLFLSVILGTSLHAVAFADPEPAFVHVDASRPLGKMPDIFRAGVFEVGEQGMDPYKRAYLQEKFFSEQIPGMTTIFIPLWEGRSFDEYKHMVEKEGLLLPSLNEARKILSGGGQVLFSLETMPLWLSQASQCDTCEYFRYPPRDYHIWRDLVAYTAAYLSRNGAGGAGYRIWEEADLGVTGHAKFWNGTKEEFYLLYHYSVEGIRSVDPLAKITFGNAYLYDNELLQGLISYAGATNLPIDYAIFHPFGAVPYSITQESVSEIQSWFQTAGLNGNVSTHAESWNSWMEKNKPDVSYRLPDDRSAERDTEFNAAYAVQALLAFDYAGITHHSFFSRVDPSYERFLNAHVIDRDQQFFGDYGMFTRDLVIKPVYNAFRALSMLSGKRESRMTYRLEATSSDSLFIGALSSITDNKSKIRVLIANFVPTDEETVSTYVDEKLDDYLVSAYGENVFEGYLTCLNDTQYPFLCIYGLPVDLRYFASCLSYHPVESCFTTLPAHLQEALVRFILDFLDISTNPRSVEVLIDNLPFNGHATLTTYLIDRDHANSCRTNKATETTPTVTECGVHGDVDRMVTTARSDSKQTALQYVADEVTAHGFSQETLTALIDAAHQCIVQDDCTATAQRMITALGYDINHLDDLTEEDYNDIIFVNTSLSTALAMKETLYYYGTFKAQDGRIFTIPTSIDTINRDPRIALEGSRQVKTVSVASGTCTEQLTMHPYSIVLLELSR